LIFAVGNASGYCRRDTASPVGDFTSRPSAATLFLAAVADGFAYRRRGAASPVGIPASRPSAATEIPGFRLGRPKAAM